MDMVYNNKIFYYIYFHTKKSLNRFLDKKVCFFLIPVCWFYQKMSKKVKNNICSKIQNIKLLLFFFTDFDQVEEYFINISKVNAREL